LIEGLEEGLGGFEVLDHDVLFDQVARAKLVGTDGDGRLVWVLVAEGDDDRTALTALDALAYSRANVELVARHFQRGTDSGTPARLALVLPAPRPELVERLRPLLAQGLELLTVRTISSPAGERSYLLPQGGAVAARPAVGESSEEAFLAGLSEGQRDLARTLARRMKRIDDDIRVEASAVGLVWSHAGLALAQIERRDTGLAGGVAPEFQPLRLASELDLERFLDAAVHRLVELLDPAGAEEPGESPSRLLAEGPLLTAEEIAAFRD